jgi:hypothetical protein
MGGVSFNLLTFSSDSRATIRYHQVFASRKNGCGQSENIKNPANKYGLPLLHILCYHLFTMPNVEPANTKLEPPKLLPKLKQNPRTKKTEAKLL